jgi:hypothetical protein
MKRFIVLEVAAAIAMMTAMASAAEESRSAAPAAALKTSLDRLKLEAIAARDPEDPGRYIAALYVPGSQLLVVSAPYPAPAALDKKIGDGRYMDAYLDMQSVADHKGHFFVVDMNADGLTRVCGPEQAFDSTTVESATPIAFDGNWKAQKLSQDDYDAAFRTNDDRYARMLGVLSAALARKITMP